MNEKSLSRRTANQRERVRMKRLNEAFEKLRKKLPSHVLALDRSSKVETLRMSAWYIRKLFFVLEKNSRSNFFVHKTFDSCGQFSLFSNNSRMECLQLLGILCHS